MIARPCGCPQPMVFDTEDGRCTWCGYIPTPIRIYPSTRRLAYAIAEYVVGIRRGERRTGRQRKRTTPGP